MSFKANPVFQSDFSDAAQRFSQAIADELGDAKLNQSTQQLFASRWQEAIEQGWQACLVPEEYGGLGGSLTDFCSLLEASSRHALRLPVASGFGVVPVLLNAIADARSRDALAQIAQGHLRLQPVILDPGACDIRFEMDTLHATQNPDGGVTLQGRISGVEQIPDSTRILLACPSGSRAEQDESVVVLLDWNQVTRWQAQAERIDARTTISLEFDQTRLSAGQVLASSTQAARAIAIARDYGCLFACVSAAGAMGMNIEQTLQYLRDRHQFGVSLSSFQALRHYMAAIYAKYECYRALVRATVERVQNADEVNSEALSMLKIYLGQVGQMVAHTVIQVHGGMGMTEDLFASRLNKSILMSSMEYGDGQFHTGRVLDSRLDPAL